jgi:hypothetical protein
MELQQTKKLFHNYQIENNSLQLCSTVTLRSGISKPLMIMILFNNRREPNETLPKYR